MVVKKRVKDSLEDRESYERMKERDRVAKGDEVDGVKVWNRKHRSSYPWCSIHFFVSPSVSAPFLLALYPLSLSFVTRQRRIGWSCTMRMVYKTERRKKGVMGEREE